MGRLGLQSLRGPCLAWATRGLRSFSASTEGLPLGARLSPATGLHSRPSLLTSPQASPRFSPYAVPHASPPVAAAAPSWTRVRGGGFGAQRVAPVRPQQPGASCDWYRAVRGLPSRRHCCSPRLLKPRCLHPAEVGIHLICVRKSQGVCGQAGWMLWRLV